MCRRQTIRGVVGLVAAVAAAAATASAATGPAGQAPDDDGYDYRVLATARTSTMEREMNAAAAEGYRFRTVMGGATAFGGSELVTVMLRGPSGQGGHAYRVLAASRTSTMQREMREAGAAGYDYRGQTVFASAFGGEEVVVIMERDTHAPRARYDYLLLATARTSTMQDELTAAGQDGFELVGMTVGETGFGGSEVVVILRRAVSD